MTADAEKDLALRLGESLRHFFRLKLRFKDEDGSGLRPSERMLLMTLAHSQAVGGERLSTLSTHHAVSPAATTQLVDALEKAGYVERLPDPSDRRSILVNLTGKGREYNEKAEALFLGRITALARQLGEEDSNQLVRLLERILEHFGKERN